MSKEQWDNSFSDQDFVYGEKENVLIHDRSGFIPEYSKVGCPAEGEGAQCRLFSKTRPRCNEL